MALRDHISSIKEQRTLGQFVNEASISQGVVLRLAQALGWPIFDSKTVAHEFAVEGRRVDRAPCPSSAKTDRFPRRQTKALSAELGVSGGFYRALFPPILRY